MRKKDERTIWQIRLPLSVKIAGKALAEKRGLPEGDLVAEAVRQMIQRETQERDEIRLRKRELAKAEGRW